MEEQRRGPSRWGACKLILSGISRHAAIRLEPRMLREAEPPTGLVPDPASRPAPSRVERSVARHTENEA